MEPQVDDWFDRRTSASAKWPLDHLMARKGDTTVSVVLPALNEAATVASIVEAIRDHLGDGAARGRRLVDELIVLDSGSTDSTAALACGAGAKVVHRDEVLPRIPTVPGKGEAMWRSLAATTGDIVVFIDADLRSFTPHYITGLLGPLLSDVDVSLVKAIYERPLVEGDTVVHAGGGRVTELVARPLINLHWPELAGVVQPLAGEYAARRNLLEQLPFPCGYGVELGLLVDTLHLAGLDAIAQVDLGIRLHRHHGEQRLGRMAAEIMMTAYERLDLRSADLGTTLAQYDHTDAGYTITTHDVSGLERPPMITVPEYSAARTK